MYAASIFSGLEMFIGLRLRGLLMIAIILLISISLKSVDANPMERFKRVCVSFYLSKKQQETVEHLKHPPNRTERKKIDNYIHLCKPMVTLSLKKYVNSNEAEFQPNIFLFFIALSAIEPVVYDLFLVRLKTDNKELEVQRMFIVQTLFELVRYNKVIQYDMKK
ncbi:unnamed protein product [Rotaria sp. Silwood1]|nr:unnamed protein product [Rotaria sp. Silwood1]